MYNQQAPTMINSSFYFIAFLLVINSNNIAAQISGTTKTIDGYVISFKVFGKGEPLLIINGGPGMNSKGFEPLAVELSKNFQVITYDQRGTGSSTLPRLNDSTISMHLMIQDIESLRKHLQIKQWMLLGHSFGGMLASMYATIYPNNIKKIVLSSSGGIDLELLDYLSEEINGKLSQTQRREVSYWTNRLNGGDTSYNARLQRGLNLAPAYVFDKKFVPTIGARLTEGNSLINQLIWSDLRRINFNCTAKLTSFRKPVLIIQGKNDILKLSTAIKIQKAFKNSQLVFLDNCAHYGWLDRPDKYFAAVNLFLKA